MRTFLLSLLLVTTSLGTLSAPAIRISTPAVLAATPIQSTAPEPLPRGCGSVTPPGDELAACCINGFVYMDGAIIAGAEVTITSPRGDSVVLYTQVYSGTEIRPFYQMSLSVAPLNVQTGETITITAHYSSHEKSLSYVVQPGSQQVDVVLGQNQAVDMIFDQEIWGQAAPGDFNRPTGIVINRFGEVYVVDNDNARIQVFDTNGGFLRQWGTRGSLPGQFRFSTVIDEFGSYSVFPSAVTVDANDNVYVADSGNHRIQRFDRFGVWLNQIGGFGHLNGQFDTPRGVAVAADGSIYVADTNNHRVQKFNSQSAWIATLGSGGTANGQFRYPMSIAVDSVGEVYIADFGNNRIQKFHTSGLWSDTWPIAEPVALSIGSDNIISIIVGGQDGTVVGQKTTSGLPVNNWGVRPSVGIASDAAGNLYIPHWPSSYSYVAKYTPDGTLKMTWGKEGRANGQFAWPTGIAVDGSGNMFVADLLQDSIQRFRADRTWVITWKSDRPDGVATDTLGNVYVAAGSVGKYTSAGVLLTSLTYPGHSDSPARGVAVAEDGTIYTANGSPLTYDPHGIGVYNADGSWRAFWAADFGQSNEPMGIAVDRAGNVFIADRSYNTVQQWVNGVYVRSLGTSGSAQGQFRNPIGLATDQLGRVYVVDSANHRIQVFSGTGVWLGSFGSLGSRVGEFLFPQWIALDTQGRIYVTDKGNQRVEIFRPMTYTRPIATITHVSAPSVGQDDTLTLRGLGQDSDQTPAVTAYRWTSDKDGMIGTAATLSRAAHTLTSGSHRITLEIQDGEGQWSDPVNTSIYVAAPPQVTWTALLYLAGDYGDRGKQLDAFTAALAHLQTSLRNPAIRVAVQVDGPADGDTYRLLILPGNPPTVTRLEDIGEKAMDSPAALAEFLRWGQGSFPAQHYYLAVANHGQAIQGIAWDLTSDLRDDGVPNYSAYLTSAELGQALRAEGVAPIDVVHLDACSMNLLEVAYELRPLTDVPTQSRLLIASQYLGWNYFAYDTYITAIGAGDTPAQVALSVTGAYAARARADRVPYTIAALDLGRAGPMATAVDNLGAELAAYVNNDRSRLDAIETIWQTSPHFESNGDYLNNVLDEYVDLPAWAGRVQLGVASPAVKQRAFDLINELTGPNPFIIAGSNHVGHGNLPLKYANGAFIDLSGASGVSIFYPGRQDTVAFDSYVNNRLFAFTGATRWADFLLSGVGNLAPGPLRPFSGPLTNLDQDHRVLLPLIYR